MQNDITVLLAKYFSGQASEEEAATVKHWIAGDERNQADFLLLERLWNKSAGASDLHFDTEKALQAVHIKLQPATRSPQPAKIITLRRVIAAAAAVLVFLAGWYLFNSDGAYKMVLADTDVKELLLDDGSKVYLRKGATLSFPEKFSGHNRSVKLTGEAFFEVQSNPSKPFMIAAEQAAIQVAGTSFLVEADTAITNLVVKTGRVWFRAANDTANHMMVVAGERAIFDHGSLTKTANTDKNFIAWQTKELKFDKMPMRQVVAALKKYYRVNVEIKKEDSAQIAPVVMTGYFVNEPIVRVLNTISAITNFRVREISKIHYQISLK